MRSTNGSANTTPERNAPALPQAAPRARSSRAKRSPARPRRRARREGGPAGFGGGLSSARDRRRVLERNEAERARVERALADAPIQDLVGEPLAPRPAIAPMPAPSVAPPHGASPDASLGASFGASFDAFLDASLGASFCASSQCPVCASAKLASDEVFAAGQVMRLVECLHCDHRFTARPRARWSDLGARMTRTSVAATA